MTFTLSPDDIRRCRDINLGTKGLIMDIVRAVCDEAEIPIQVVLGDTKTQHICAARWLICYIAHVDQGHSLNAIARVLKYKDHTGPLHGVQRERERRESEGG